MSTCAVIGLSVLVLVACIAGVVWINRAVARACEEDEQHDPY